MELSIKPQNNWEFVVWWFIIGTFALYILGLLYPLNSLLGWSILGYIGYQKYQKQSTPVEIEIPLIVWIWIISMLVMLVGSAISCYYADIGFKDTIRVTIRWGMRSALLALFPLFGCLPIRAKLIYRAVCLLCLQSLIFIFIGYTAYFLRLPETIYTLSFISKLTGTSEIYYQVHFYSLGDIIQTQELRLFLFAPWGPALGLVSSIYFFISLQEEDWQWRFIGTTGSIAMCLVSGSRTAIVTIPAVLLLMAFLHRWHFVANPKVQIALGFSSLIAGIFSSNIISFFNDVSYNIVNARAKSSRVREILASISLRRWQDSPIWGHAQQTEGPIVAANMPLGSHHTWIGLLYVRGIVGFTSLLIPIFFSLIDLIIKSSTSKLAQLGLKILLVLILYSFVEEIYLLSYLYWPALVLLGIIFNEKKFILDSTESHHLSKSIN